MRIAPTPSPSSINTVAAAAYRVGLTQAADIRRTMADDFREICATQGGVTEQHLQLRGWTLKQITAHASAARDIANRRSLAPAS